MAAEVFNDMPETAKNAPFTRFLMFKVALRNSDNDLGMAASPLFDAMLMRILDSY